MNKTAQSAMEGEYVTLKGDDDNRGWSEHPCETDRGAR